MTTHLWRLAVVLIHLLRIDAAPRASKSNSIALADAFVTAYTDALPSVTVDVMNVWDEKRPEFDNAAIDAKYKGVAGSMMNEAETGVWNRIQTLVARFKRADRIVLGVPMWNFAYPYKLKQLIDPVSQRNMLLTYDGGAVRSTSANTKGDGYLYQRPGVPRGSANPAVPVRPPIRLCRVLARFHWGARGSSIGG
jgi:putative NADPH-quinone reductase